MRNWLYVNSGIQTYQILTNNDEVCIPSLSSIVLAVLLCPSHKSEGVSNWRYWTPSILKPASIFTLEYAIFDLKPPSVRATIKKKEFLVKNEDILRMWCYFRNNFTQLRLHKYFLGTTTFATRKTVRGRSVLDSL